MKFINFSGQARQTGSVSRDSAPQANSTNKSLSTHTPFETCPVECVLAEIELTGGQLRKASNSNGATFSSKDGKFGIRFILKNSYKVPGSNFVNNQFVAQLLVSDQSTIKKEYAADKVKLEARENNNKKNEISDDVTIGTGSQL